ncbi:MAG: hypothetical protein AUH78_20350 [Gemmatimonadetes bacterium 13_1_40CM_4_69_8]|nr:MAG: hypothetical protein AUH78_20350 [Gemmatimonadetes bacterium 13_1_40CM_4_69_8]
MPIRMNVANALQWLGNLYRNPADAIKEHVSNAVDEHLKAAAAGTALERCTVVFRIAKRQVEIEYPYAMTRQEFESALQRVADSAKRHSEVTQVGQLGIGMFSFQQVGKKCTFLSRKNEEAQTIRVILREGGDDAEIDTARKVESLERPGFKIVISELKFDPTRARGPLAPEKLTRLFAERFGTYIERGQLAIQVSVDSKLYLVEPPTIHLPRIGRGLERVHLPSGRERLAGLTLFFDPSGTGTVGIRHAGVLVVDDLKQITAYGLEESVYASGYVKGWVDADFLRPLPARTGFEENKDWIDLLDALDRCRPQIETEVEQLKAEQEEKELSEVQRQAVRLAREILDLEDFRDLELPGGLSKARAPNGDGRVEPTGHQTGERAQDPGDHVRPYGPRIRYQEVAFSDGPRRHSRYTQGVVQANTLHPDYQQELSSASDAKLAYATLLIGKEAIAFNDKAADDQLEKLLSFYFTLKRRLRTNGRGQRRHGLHTPRTKRSVS